MSQRTGGLFWECGVTFLDSSIFRTFGLKIANLTQFWNKFGSMSKNNLAIVFLYPFGHFHLFSFSLFSIKDIINTLL